MKTLLFNALFCVFLTNMSLCQRGTDNVDRQYNVERRQTDKQTNGSKQKRIQTDEQTDERTDKQT